MRRAVFLDRDGTINKEVDYLLDVRKLRILPGVAEAIGQFNKLGFLVVVLTNQAAIARGWLSEERVEQIHDELIKRLAKKGAKIDAIYYCPHLPDSDKRKYRLDCQCRKPNIGMFKQAVKNFKIDLGKSFFIGDRTGDILAGQRAGTKTILVQTGYAGKDNLHNVKPDATARNLIEAVSIIRRLSKNA